MTTKRSYFGAASVKNKVYAIGGWDGTNIFKSCEVYDPETNQWSSIKDMSSMRSGLGVTSLNGKVYAIGGWDGKKSLNSGEVYDPETNQWSSITNMSIARTGVSLSVLNGKIYAAGGSEVENNISSGVDNILGANVKLPVTKVVEVYDPVIDKWSNVHSPLTN